MVLDILPGVKRTGIPTSRTILIARTLGGLRRERSAERLTAHHTLPHHSVTDLKTHLICVIAQKSAGA
ncbi:hypothetical protein [Coleofasciculus sp. F4-SAH-05]|uniref:hypothetical protein n=1 Tax=Coleofasciculus TaxID=669368 RepID=UPI004062C208